MNTRLFADICHPRASERRFELKASLVQLNSATSMIYSYQKRFSGGMQHHFHQWFLRPRLPSTRCLLHETRSTWFCCQVHRGHLRICGNIYSASLPNHGTYRWNSVILCSVLSSVAFIPTGCQSFAEHTHTHPKRFTRQTPTAHGILRVCQRTAESGELSEYARRI